MNDIIKLIFFNILLFILLYLDKRLAILFIILLMLYLITIKSSLKSKTIEGFEFYRNFVEMPVFKDYDYTVSLPNSAEYNSKNKPFTYMYSFFNGGGTSNKVINTDNVNINKLNDLLDELINLFEKKQENCQGNFSNFGMCSKTCGYGKQKQVYNITREKGSNGTECPYKNGYTNEIDCIMKSCDIGDSCENNLDCGQGYCDKDKKICVSEYKCDKGFDLVNCLSEIDCLKLNQKYNTTSENRFIWYNDDKTCVQNSELETKTLTYDRIRPFLRQTNS